MSIDPAHLSAVLAYLAPQGNELSRLLKKARSSDAGERSEALHYIQQRDPELFNYLMQAWSFDTGVAVHLWRLPCLDESDVADIFGAFDERWTTLENRQETRVHKIRLRGQELSAIIRLNKTTTVSYEDEPKSVPRSSDHEVRIDFSKEARLAEVYASFRDARLSLFTFLDWVFEVELPRAVSKKQHEYLFPISFSERGIAEMADRLNLPMSEIHGEDPDGKIGEYRLTSKKDGFNPTGLDRSLQVVERQTQAANKERQFVFPFVHNDGYAEQAVTTFYFTRPMSHIRFPRKTSRYAMDYVIQEAYREVVRAQP